MPTKTAYHLFLTTTFFFSVFESSQSLFWASFGMVDLSSFELTGIKTYTRFWGLLMFGSYSVINVIVLLNLLIAMMSNSYAMIDEHSDTEWKFARTKLWLKYFEEGSTLPPPFNIFPRPKMFLKLCGIRKKDKLRRMSTKVGILQFQTTCSKLIVFSEGTGRKKKGIIAIQR